jgi:hypothetical protein
LTHPAAAEAFRVGDASAVARLVAGAPAVTVFPMLKVATSDIPGTVGGKYCVLVAESPDPPATSTGA